MLVKDIALFPNATEQIFQWTAGKLSNDGEKLILRDTFGIIADHVRYNDNFPWPLEADGAGASLVLISPDKDNHFGENWVADFSTDVIDFPISSGFSVFPNPTNGLLTIQTRNGLIEQVEILNTFGQLLSKKQTNETEIKLDLSIYPKGIYFIRINQEKTVKILVGL